MTDEPPPPDMVQELAASVAQDALPPAPQKTLRPGGTAARVHQLIFHGKGGSLLGIYTINILLTLLTVGIYYFWGKTRIRSYMMSQTEFAGDRFAYHGTGKELLVGFLKATVLFGIPLAALIIAPEFLEPRVIVGAVASLVATCMVMVAIPVAMVGARRYRLSRTSWRGVLFSFRGSAKEFIKVFLSGSLLMIPTIGLYYPFFETKKHAFMVSHSYFGNKRFQFDGRGRDLFGSFLLALLLFLPTLGLYWFWFLAKKHRFFWEHTSFASARFRSTVTGGRLFLLKLGNLLLLLATLGLAWPWVVVRNARFTLRYLTLEGPLDLAAIEQQAQAASATGEGLASFLDMDAGFGFG
ncbi:MAG: YjgN family protein [Candidatus Methylomirabilales bacterium]